MNPEWTYMKKLIWLAKRFGKVAGHVARSAMAVFNSKFILPLKSLLVYLEPKQSGTPTWYNSDSESYVLRGVAQGNTEELSKIVGGSVVWNQLANVRDSTNSYTQNGITFTKTDKGYIANGTATGEAILFISPTGTANDARYINYQNNHLFLLTGCPSGGSTETYYASWTLVGSDYGSGRMTRHSSGTVDGYVYFRVRTGVTVNNLLVNIQVADLTLMFGPTLADYIYSLEQAHAGDGVAFYKKFNPYTYSPYDPGSIKSLTGLASKKNVGFNLWDEEWENGIYNATTGLPEPNSNRIRSKNPIPVTPNTVYYVKAPVSYGNIVIVYCDADGNALGNSGVIINTTFTTPNGCYYIKFNNATTNVTTYNHDICINLSDPSKNGTYEAHVEYDYTLDSSVELKGIYKVENGKLVSDGDEWLPSGVVNEKYGIVDLGTLNYTYRDDEYSYGYFQTSPPNKKLGSMNMICSKYCAIIGNRANLVDKSIAIRNGTTYYVCLRDDAYTDVATFKTAMSGVYLVYELETPTTSSATPYTSSQSIVQGGTEEFVGANLPVGQLSTAHDVYEIEGASEVNVHVRGKNLLDFENVLKYSNWSDSLVTYGSYSTAPGRIGYAIDVTEGKTYAISFGLSASSYPYYFYLCRANATTQTSERVDRFSTDTYYKNAITFTAESGWMYYLRVSAGESNFQTEFINKVSTGQLEFGSTATPYEPYQTPEDVQVKFPPLGANQWDEEWELGGFDYTTGQPAPSDERIRSKNFCPCLPNTTYFFKIPNQNLRVLYYNANKEYVGFNGGWWDTSQVFTTPNDARYFKIAGSAGYGTTYNHDIAINYPSTVTTYNPFTNTVYKGTLDVVSGELTVTHRMMDLGELSWEKITGSFTYFRSLSSLTDAVGNSSSAFDGACSRYVPRGSDRLVDGDGSVAIGGVSKKVFVYDSVYSSYPVSYFEYAVHGTQLLYELETPQVYHLTPEEVMTVLGENHIWADEGDVEVYYSKGL